MLLHNIVIKRKKEVVDFEPWISMTNQCELLTKINPMQAGVLKS